MLMHKVWIEVIEHPYCRGAYQPDGSQMWAHSFVLGTYRFRWLARLAALTHLDRHPLRAAITRPAP